MPESQKNSNVPITGLLRHSSKDELNVILRQDASTFLEDMEKRITLCIGTTRSNCVGTALYIIGAQIEDTYIDPDNTYKKHLTKLKRISKPVRGCLVSLQYKCGLGVRLNHLSIVSSVDPLLVTERRGAYGPFVVDAPFRWSASQIRQAFREYRIETVYYLPKALKRLQSQRIRV